MATKVFKPILGKKIRVVDLDKCGNVPDPEAEDAMAVTDGFISVQLSAQVEDGTEITTRKANGDICVNEKLSDTFKYFNVTTEFCGVHPGMLSLVSNAVPYENDDSDQIGITVPEGTVDGRFSIELWSGLSGAACPDDENVEEASGYLLLPQVVAGTLGDITFNGTDAVTFTVQGMHTKGGNNWGTGPFDVLLDGQGSKATLPTAVDPDDHLLLVETGVAPPASTDGLVAMPA